MNRRVLMGCGVALGLSICVLLAGIGAILVGFRPEEPTDVEIKLSAPESVPRGEPFAVEIQITNVYTGEQILDSIDISTRYLEHITVTGTTPPATEEFDVPFVQFHSYTFEEELSMLESMTVVFEMVGEEEGLFTGDIDVCINKPSSCQTIELSMIVGTTSGR